MSNLRFKCPECGNTELEEVLAGVTKISEVLDVRACREKRAWIYIDYDIADLDGSEELFYQCGKCGHVLHDNGFKIDCNAGLVKWLFDHAMLDEAKE